MYEYAAKVIRVIDADTFVALVDYGFRQHGEWHLRVLNLWSPELSTPEGVIARTAAMELLPVGTPVIVRTRLTRTGTEATTLDRYLAEVTLPDGRDFASVMVAAGYGTAVKT